MLFIYLHVVYLYVIYLLTCCLFIYIFIYLHVVYLFTCCLFIYMLFIYLHELLLIVSSRDEPNVLRSRRTFCVRHTTMHQFTLNTKPHT